MIKEISLESRTQSPGKSPPDIIPPKMLFNLCLLEGGFVHGGLCPGDYVRGITSRWILSVSVETVTPLE